MFTKKSVPVYLFLLIIVCSLIFVHAGMRFSPIVSPTTCDGGECLGNAIIFPFVAYIFNPLQYILSPVTRLLVSSFFKISTNNIWYFILGGLLVRFLLIALFAIIPFLVLFFLIPIKVSLENKKRWKSQVLLVYVCFVVLFSGYTFIPVKLSLSPGSSLSDIKNVQYVCGSDESCFRAVIQLNAKNEMGEIDSALTFPRLIFQISPVQTSKDNEVMSYFNSDEISRVCEVDFQSSPFFVLNCQINKGVKNISDLSAQDCNVYTSQVFSLEDPIVKACLTTTANPTASTPLNQFVATSGTSGIFKPIDFSSLGFTYTNTPGLEAPLYGSANQYYALNELYDNTDALRVSITQADAVSENLFSSLFAPPQDPSQPGTQETVLSQNQTTFLGSPATILHLGNDYVHTSRMKFIANNFFFVVEVSKVSGCCTPVSISNDDLDTILVSIANKVVTISSK